MTPRESIAPLLATLRDVFRQLDGAAQTAIDYHAANGSPISCGKGCGACCHVLTTISVPEGLLLADALLSRPGWRTLLPALVTAARADCAPGLTRRSRFLDHTPCGLLDVASQTCTVYADRPGACRFHTSVTPRENCARDAVDNRTAAIDMLDLEGALWTVCADMSKALGVGPVSQAPVSLMTLACLALLTEDPEVLAVTDGLPDPEAWMLAHVVDLHDEEEANLVEHPEDKHTAERLYAIGRKAFGGAS